MSNRCKICCENVGYLGKIVEFIYYKIFRIKMFKHKCNEHVLEYQRHLRYTPREPNPTLGCFERDYFIPMTNPFEIVVPDEEIELIKKNKIKHKFIKNG